MCLLTRNTELPDSLFDVRSLAEKSLSLTQFSDDLFRCELYPAHQTSFTQAFPIISGPIYWGQGRAF